MKEKSSIVFPNPKNIKYGTEFFRFAGYSIFTTYDFMAAAKKLRDHLNNQLGYCFEIFIGEGDGISIKKQSMEPEGYMLEVDKESAVIKAADIRGALYGVQTLIQLIQKDNKGLSIPSVIIEDKPYKKIRGVHLYIPPKEGIDEFKRLLDVLCFLKYNTVIIEVGGGMQYERHPEVNKAWEWFCDTADNKFPGGPRNLQWADRYWKDSTHTELAGGKYISKDEMRSIIDYAKSLGFCIIPEIQALSHCYYLTMAHREIAEQPDDPFPDSFCPSNEESYKLYFDIADEIIEVFSPEMVSIGHDEIRILGECPRCKDKSGHELLSYEINRLHEFYSKRNIRMAMWAEKLQLFTSFDGRLCGGNFEERTDAYGRYWRILATHEAIDMIDNDILMIDWYHSMGTTTQDCFLERNMEVIFGNFSGCRISNWDKRSADISGAEVSTWCLPDEATLGRDGIMHNIIFSSALLWQSDYNDNKYRETLQNVLGITPTVRNIFRGYTSPLYLESNIKLLYQGEEEKCTVSFGPFESFDSKVDKIIDKLEGFKGVPVDKGHIFLRTDIYADSLVFLQACTKEIEFVPSYEFPKKSVFEIATYAIIYEDGSVELSNVHYGLQCACIDMDWSRQRQKPGELVKEIDAQVSLENAKYEESPYYKIKDHWRDTISYFTTPIIGDGKTLYAYEWINPKPKKKITAIKAIHTTKDIKQTVLLFAIAALSGS